MVTAADDERDACAERPCPRWNRRGEARSCNAWTRETRTPPRRPWDASKCRSRAAGWPIGDEAHQLALGDGNAQGVLILGKIGDRLKLAFRVAYMQQGLAHDAGQRLEQHRGHIAGGDPAIARRKLASKRTSTASSLTSTAERFKISGPGLLTKNSPPLMKSGK